MDVNKQVLCDLDQVLNGSHLDKIPNHDDDSIEEIADSLPRGDMDWQRDRLFRHANRLREIEKAIVASSGESISSNDVVDFLKAFSGELLEWHSKGKKWGCGTGDEFDDIVGRYASIFLAKVVGK